MIRSTRLRRSAPVVVHLSVVAAVCSAVHGADPLANVPSDVAGVIGFNDLKETLKNVTGFFARISTENDLSESELQADTVVLEQFLGLKGGTCDFSKPFLVVLTKPQIDRRSVVIGFTPANAKRFASRLTGRADTIQRLSEGDSENYVCLRDGVAFMSARKKAIRTIIECTPDRSLSATLEDRQKQLHRDNDVYFHLRVDRWRAVYITPFIPLLSQFARPGMTVLPEENAKAVQVIVDWFLEVLGSVLDQMDSVTLALSFDGQGFRFVHDHAFRPGGAVADYLSGARKSGVDLWAGLPDRPFFMTVASDWVSPADGAAMAGLAKRILGEPSVAGKISEEERRRLVEGSAAFYRDIRGRNIMFTTREGQLQPIEMIGTYAVDDPAKVAAQMRSIVESSCQALATFMPSGGYRIESRSSRVEGVSFDEYRFLTDEMDPATRSMVVAMYGENCCVRQAIAGNDRILYALSSEGADSFVKLVKAPPGSRCVGQNKMVEEMLRHLAPHPHIVIVFDIGRAVALGPRMMKAGMAAMQQSIPDIPDMAPPSQGPLLGWSGVVGDRSFTGQAYISADGVVRAFDLIKKFGEHMRRGYQRPATGAAGAEGS